MALNPKSISINDLELRINQIFNLLTSKFSSLELTMGEEEENLRPINETEFKSFKSVKLIKLANWYNAAYTDNEDPVSIIFRRINNNRYYAQIEAENGDMDGQGLYITKEELKEFIEIFNMQLFTYHSSTFVGFLPDYEGEVPGLNIKGDPM